MTRNAQHGDRSLHAHSWLLETIYEKRVSVSYKDGNDPSFLAENSFVNFFITPTESIPNILQITAYSTMSSRRSKFSNFQTYD
jgi:hypothetical protein